MALSKGSKIMNIRWEALTRISPNGATTFVNDLYVGRVPERKITKARGIFNLMEPSDSIMSDHGFKLGDDLPDFTEHPSMFKLGLTT